MSEQLYLHCMEGRNAGYTWDWGDARAGSWRPEGKETTISRYTIDFEAKVQKNIDNGRLRSIRIVWIPASDVTPCWTGEIPWTTWDETGEIPL